jgi:hypothetical protein
MSEEAKIDYKVKPTGQGDGISMPSVHLGGFGRPATSGTWKKGQGPPRGSRAGIPNKISRTLKDAAIAAAEELGQLDRDKWAEAVKAGESDGLKRFFKVLAVEQMKTFGMVLARIMPLHVIPQTKKERMLTEEQVIAELKEYGLPVGLVQHLRSVEASEVESVTEIDPADILPYPDPEVD